jgi:hypothetical protein
VQRRGPRLQCFIYIGTGAERRGGSGGSNMPSVCPKSAPESCLSTLISAAVIGGDLR